MDDPDPPLDPPLEDTLLQEIFDRRTRPFTPPLTPPPPLYDQDAPTAAPPVDPVMTGFYFIVWLILLVGLGAALLSSL